MTPQDATQQATTTNVVEQIGTLSSLTLKSIGCNPKAAGALEEGDKREIHLARIYGMLSGIETGEVEETGQVYTALIGNIQAVNMQAGSPESAPGKMDGLARATNYGSVYSSGRCFMPPGTHEMLIAQAKGLGLEGGKADGRQKKVAQYIKDGKSLNFAVDVYVKRAGNASGITYVSKNLLEPTTNDPLTELRGAIAAFETKLTAQANAAGHQLPAVTVAAPKQIGTAVKK